MTDATVGDKVAEGCPAFAEGCPYASRLQSSAWIKAKEGLTASSGGPCPAFEGGCPFRGAQNLDALCGQLQKLPKSHAGGTLANAEDSQPAHAALLEMLQAVHKASQNVKEEVGGDCPVFQASCPFKNCLTSSGTPLVQELETRTWGLMYNQEAKAEEVTEALPSAESASGATANEEDDGVGLALKLKEGTKEAHKAAESVHFVREFIKGRVSRDVYAQFVVNLFYVYEALETALDECWENPLVEPLYFPDELCRAATLREDAEFYLGPGWEHHTEPSPVAREYVARLREVAKLAPELLTPHAYTRYLGDLSGGQLLRRCAVRGLKLPDDGQGVRFYMFKRVRDAKAFKNMYRARLDALPADGATADRMVIEANHAFDLNTRMFKELDKLMGHDVELAPLASQPLPLATQPMGTASSAASAAAASCPFAALAAAGVAMPADHPPMAHRADGTSSGATSAAKTASKGPASNKEGAAKAALAGGPRGGLLLMAILALLIALLLSGMPAMR